MQINITREQNNTLIKLVEMAAQEMWLKRQDVLVDWTTTKATRNFVAGIYEESAKELEILAAELKQAGHLEDLPVGEDPIDLEERSWIDEMENAWFDFCE